MLWCNPKQQKRLVDCSSKMATTKRKFNNVVVCEEGSWYLKYLASNTRILRMAQLVLFRLRIVQNMGCGRRMNMESDYCWICKAIRSLHIGALGAVRKRHNKEKAEPWRRSRKCWKESEYLLKLQRGYTKKYIYTQLKNCSAQNKDVKYIFRINFWKYLPVTFPYGVVSLFGDDQFHNPIIQIEGRN